MSLIETNDVQSERLNRRFKSKVQKGSTMNISSLNIAGSALNAAATEVWATAHNVANVNTANFNPTDIHYQTGSNGLGVEPVFRSRDSLLQPAKEQFLDIDASLDKELSFNTENFLNSARSLEAEQANSVDIATEFVHLIMAENMFNANAVSISTDNNMFGTIIDLKA